MFPDPFSPRWTSPLARTKGESAEPDLWPDYAWIPALGPTGGVLFDINRRYAGIVHTGMIWRPDSLETSGAGNQWVEIGAFPIFRTVPFTWVAEIKPKTPPNWARWFGMEAPSVDRSWALMRRDSDDFYSFHVWNSANAEVNTYDAGIPCSAPLGVWTQFCGVLTAGTIAIWRNGIFNHSKSWTPPIFETTDKFWLFRTGASSGDRGHIRHFLWYSRALNSNQIARLHADPYRFLRPRRLTGWVSVGVGAFTLDADPGSYGLTGANADLLAHRLLEAAPGSYAVTGSAAQLLAKRVLDAAAGAYTVTGSDAELLAARVLLASPGTYAVTGFAADLVYTPLVAVFTLEAAPGVYSITGADAQLALFRRVLAEPGEYNIAGNEAALLAARKLNAEPGEYLVVGMPALLAFIRAMDLAPGSYNVTGSDAALTALRQLAADPGAYEITGAAAILWYSETPDQPLVVRLVSVALAHSRLVDVSLAQSAMRSVGLTQSAIENVRIN